MKAPCIFLAIAALGLAGLQAAGPSPVEVRANLAHPKVPADKPFTTYLKVGLTGTEQPTADKTSRPPVNVAIVLDRSGSMQGPKLENAKLAAKEALQHLGADDIVSIVTFDSQVDVVVPATKLTDRDQVMKAIDTITARGNTALFGGVSKGAEELRKFKNPRQVNRVILLSDGQANVGPSTPDELGRLGTSFSKEGITVTTLGLGLDYNESLMAQLASASDGNHAFINNPGELAEVFNRELGDVLSVVAQDLRITIRCPENVRPVRVLGREANIHGGTVEVAMNQLRARQDKYALLEVELPAGPVETDQLVGEVEVSYRANTADKASVVQTRSVARRVKSEQDVDNTADKPILIEVAKQIGAEKQLLAVKLSEQGKEKEAEKIFRDNSETLRRLGTLYKSDDLMGQGSFNTKLEKDQKAGGSAWEASKKANRATVNSITTQNTFQGTTTITTPPARR